MHTTSRLQSRSRLASASLVLALLAAVQSASAATQYWDPGLTPASNSGKGSGGAGTWTTAGANWSDGATDAVLAATNVAGFAGSSGAITLTTAVSAAGLSFETSNYTVGNGTVGGQLAISAQATNSQGIVVGSGVTGTTIDLGSIRLGSSGSAVSIWLANTDLVDFRNTTVYLSGSRTTKITNSTTGGTTTFAKFAVSDKPTGGTWPNTTVEVVQGNVRIDNLAAASQANGTLASYSSITAVNTTINGASNGTVTINGNNTLFQNPGIGGSLSLTFNMASGTLALGHDNALGAKNASDQATTTRLIFSSGTLVASGGARNIANAVAINGNVALGGAQALTLSGAITNTAGNRTLTVSNSAATTLSGPVFLANDDVTARTLTLAGAGNTSISGAITNNAGASTVASALTVTNTGITTLSGANTYTGVTTISAGTVFVNGSHVGAAAYSVASGATLGGTGSINLSAGNGNVTLASGAKLQASSLDGLSFTLGTGTLDLSAALSASSASMLFTLGAPGSSVVTASSASIGSGVLNFDDFSFTTGSGFGAGTYTLFDLTSFSGSLGTSLTGTVGGLNATIGLDGNDIILTASAVPEPASAAALAGLAGLALVASRRRRR